MKKIIISMLLMAAPVATFAQLKVTSDGKVCINMNTPLSNSFFSVGNSESSLSYGNIGVYSRLFAPSLTRNETNIGVLSRLWATDGDKRGIGVCGYIQDCPTGKGYGVIGCVTAIRTGIGVYGTAGGYGSMYGETVTGNYAGYFAGPTHVDGTFSATEVITPSDITIKENIISIQDEEKSNGNIIDNLMNLNVIKYTYKPKDYEADPEEAKLYEDEELAAKAQEIVRRNIQMKAAQKHYGLSAQELQEVYPDLVRKNQDGILGINYVELVPILIRSIQELKQELDEVRGGNGDVNMSRGAATAVASDYATGNILYQNTPNPFKEQTVIRFSLADNATNAAICIFDMTGKMLKKLPIASGETSVSINGWELGEGMFLYTLLVNGREIDTKRMIITK